MPTPAESAGGSVDVHAETPPVAISEHIAVVAAEGQKFAEAARRGPWEAQVAGCPGWNLRDLVRHLSEIHLWAAANVARRPGAKRYLDDRSDLAVPWPDLAVFWPADDDLVDHYLRTNDNLVRALESAPYGRRPLLGAVEPGGRRDDQRHRRPPRSRRLAQQHGSPLAP